MKYFTILVFFIASLFSLQAAETIPELISCIEGVPEAKIAEHVDAVSGQYVDVEVDLYLPGPDPLILQRNYESADFATGSKSGNWRLLSHCFLVAGVDKTHKGFTIRGERYVQQHAWAGEHLGSFLCYSGWKNTQTPMPCALKFLRKNHAVGLTNCARGEICARTFPKNNQVTYHQEEDQYTILSSDGTLRTYRAGLNPSHPLFGPKLINTFASFLQNPNFYHLVEEKLPSGNHILYSYDDAGNLRSISAFACNETIPFSKITFEYIKNTCRATSDDGRQVVYHFSPNSNQLVKVERADQPNITYMYDHNHHRLVEKTLPNGSFLQITYDSKKRVASLTDPDGTQVLLTYKTNVTNTQRPSGIIQNYCFDSEKRLTNIDTYTPQGELYTRESWQWTQERKKDSLLLYKILEDGHQNIHRCQTYVYDRQGNPLEELLYGNLTGKPQKPIHYNSDGSPHLENKEFHRKTYTYSSDKYNLVIKQGDCKGNEIVFAYKPNTNLLIAKYILEKGSVRKRFFYAYDASGVQIEEIEDDGSQQNPDKIWGWRVSSRHITRTILTEKGFPSVIEKTYCNRANREEEFLISKIINTFDSCGRLLRQETFDTENTSKFSIEHTYDEKGNLISETNPDGQTIFYTYDACHQKLTEHRPYQNKLIQYSYDLKGRCIETQETLGDLTFTTQIFFEAYGNKSAEIDRFGNRIDYKYDPFGRLSRAIYPLVFDGKQTAVNPTFRYTYDLFGNCTRVIDPKGYITEKTYNVRGQPTRIDYPDSSYELYKYDAEGSLHRQSTRDQTIYVFEYDYLGRLTRKERSTFNADGHGHWISTISNDYNAFSKIRSKNERGFTTLYKYDEAGRLIAEIKPTTSGAKQEDAKSHKKEFFYDTLNRLSSIKTWYGQEPDDFFLTIKEYNFLGQTIEERGEDAQGTLYWKKGYEYDPNGNLTQKIAYADNKPFIEAETTFDSLNNPISFTDGTGKSYRIHNDYAYLNTLSQKVLKKTLCDPAETKTEMIYDVMGRLTMLAQWDSNGRELLKREIFYDLSGNKSVEITNSSGQEYQVEWSYGPMNRLESVSQASGTTLFTYTEHGRLATRLDPGSLEPIIYTYNRDGTLQKVSHQSGKDVDLSNRYSYDRNGNIIKAHALGGIEVRRQYDAFDQLIQEEFKDDIGTYRMHYSYDKMGRRTEVILPDGSALHYAYDAFFPRSVSRCSQSGDILFTHFYDHYDQSGHLVHETLSGFCGTQKSSYDLNGTKKSMETEWVHDCILQSNQAGAVIKTETRFEEEIQSKDFSYDAWGGLIQEPEHTYSFDGLRNRTSKDNQEYILNSANQILSDNTMSFAYDPQGRLIQKGEWKFAYDPLGDLISAEKDKTQVTYTYGPFGRRLNRTQYKLNEKRRTKVSVERFFHLGCEEIGRLQDNTLLECKILGAFEEPLAIEEKEDFLVVFCDLQGNIIALLDPENREIVGSTEWSAFGEKISSDGRQSPWGYQGKREDPFTQFIAFGKRDYDPTIGRWTTPDPAGFIDGPNLYQYAWNNPLAFQDRWGLSAGHEEYIYGEVESHCFCERHRNCKRGGDFDNVNPGPYPSVPIYTFQRAIRNPSRRFDLSDLELPELPKGQVGFINGMATKYKSAREHAIYLSKIAGGYNIHAVYNATLTAALDFVGCAKELYDFVAPAPVCKLHQNWDSFFSASGNNELYLQFCHSEGAILVRNALLDYPDHLRKRILVVAIAPGAYIPKEICHRPIHYVSSRDFVPLFDKMGRRICRDTIVRIRPHPDAHFHDHDFQSKTYEKAIRNEFDKYFNMVQLW